MKVKIKHIDGVADVIAKARVVDREINLEYRFEGMTYGRTISITEAIEMGIVKKVKATNSFRSMEKDRVYEVKGVEYAEDNIACKKGDMAIDIGIDYPLHFSNFLPVL